MNNIDGMNDNHLGIACARAHELAGAWIDGEAIELRDGDERELRVHLAQCAECREFVVDARAMRGQLRGLASVESGDLWPRIEARLDMQTRSRSLRSISSRWPARIAAALVGGIGVLTLWRTVGTHATADLHTDAPDASFTSSLVRLAGITTSPTELRRVAAAPERALMLALAAHEEERR